MKNAQNIEMETLENVTGGVASGLGVACETLEASALGAIEDADALGTSVLCSSTGAVRTGSELRALSTGMAGEDTSKNNKLMFLGF